MKTNTQIYVVKILMCTNKRSGCSLVVKAFCVFQDRNPRDLFGIIKQKSIEDLEINYFFMRTC